jgi:hypothetical protein
MKKWEYKILDDAVIEPEKNSEDFDLRYDETREKMLKKYGKEGWELVTIESPGTNGVKWIFKREIK